MHAITTALPWPGRRTTTTTTTAETTPGGEEPTRWEVVASQLMPTEAFIIKGRLESHQIPAVIQQEAMGSLLGLTTGPLGWAAVLVPEPFVEQALAILAEVYEVEEEDDEDDESK